MTQAPSSIERRVEQLIEAVRGRLIVSCQALADEPLFGADMMARMAIAAAQGGAAAIRANSPADIAAIRAAVDLPIIGLFKVELPDYPVYITPRLEDAIAVAESGADMIAIDATARARPYPGELRDYIAAIHANTDLPVLADIATYDEGVAAQIAGADMISSTMSGYTDSSPKQSGPDIDLVAKLAKSLERPLLAEGRYRLPSQARSAIEAGALAVVVGGAITRPQEITRQFVEEMIA